MYRIKYFIAVLTLFCWSTGSARGATVRFEAESTGAVKDEGDAVGYDSINGVMGRAADATASNGELLFTLGNNDRKVKIVFAGTGINFIAPETTDGSDFDWILDEGAQAGTSTTVGGGGPQTSIPIVSGLPNALHTLELAKTGSGFVLRLDAFDVLDSGTRTRVEQSDMTRISYAVPAQWALNDSANDAAEEASGGTIGYTGFDGATATLDFTGTGVALIANARPDAQLWQYDIDGGARTGTIDLAAANTLHFGNWHRWPMLLANDLPPGNHTLVLTADIPSGGVCNFDAIDVFNPVPEPSSLLLLGLALLGFTALRYRR